MPTPRKSLRVALESSIASAIVMALSVRGVLASGEASDHDADELLALAAVAIELVEEGRVARPPRIERMVLITLSPRSGKWTASHSRNTSGASVHRSPMSLSGSAAPILTRCGVLEKTRSSSMASPKNCAL